MRRSHRILLEILLWLSAFTLVGGIGILVLELFEEDPSALAVAGALGLILTQTIGLVGLLMRSSSDSQAEERLTADTALRAVELVQPQESGGSVGRSSAAAIALVELGRVNSALTLVEALWPEGDINSEAAVRIIDVGLRSQDKTTRAAALTVLAGNARRVTPVGSTAYYLPDVLEDQKWVTERSRDEQYALLSFLVRVYEHMTVGGGTKDLNPLQLAGRLSDFVGLLALVAKIDDGDVTVKAKDATRNSALHLMQGILPIFTLPGHSVVIPVIDGKADPRELHPQIESALSDVDHEVHGEFIVQIASVQQWVKQVMSTIKKQDPESGTSETTS